MRQGNFFYLLGGLLILLLATPLALEHPDAVGRITIDLAVTITLIIGVWSLSESRKWFLVGLGLAIAAVVSALVINVGGIEQLIYVHLFILLVFFVLSIAIAGRDVLFGGPVTANRLVGVVCIYLLLGMIWAILYVFLNTVSPGAFSGVESGAPAVQFPRLVYYSFVTMTTLGYGDITPMSPIAGTLAYLEAVFGQSYIAVVVAELVAMHIGQRQVANGESTATIR